MLFKSILFNLGYLTRCALPMAVGLAMAVTATTTQASVVRYEFDSGPLLLDAVVSTPSLPGYVPNPQEGPWTFFVEFDLDKMPFESLRNVSISAYLLGVRGNYSLRIFDPANRVLHTERGVLDWFRTDLFDAGILDTLRMTTNEAGEVVDYLAARGDKAYYYTARTGRRTFFELCGWCSWPEGRAIWRSAAPVDLRLVSGPLPPEPIPVPAGIILLTGGIGALVSVRRRATKAESS